MFYNLGWNGGIDMVNNCVPLMLTNQYGNKYPGIWDKLDQVYKMEKERPVSERRSNDRLTDIVKMYNENYEHIADFWNWGKSSESFGLLVDQDMLYLTQYLSLWRVHKQIYKFPKELENVLYSQNEGYDTPVKILENLPYDSIYIETNCLLYDEKSVLGFFVSRIDARTDLNGAIGYQFMAILEDLSTESFMFRYDNISEKTTIYDAIFNTILKDNIIYDKTTGIKVNDNDAKEVTKEILDDGFENGKYKILPKMLQLILYICAENKEIEENYEQKKITRQPKAKQFIKDKYREVQIWDCGNKISEKIKTFLVTDKHNSDIIFQRDGSGIGKSKSPHSRRGHWHHFWTGKIGTVERKLILRWVAPTFVNGTPNTVNVNMVVDE